MSRLHRQKLRARARDEHPQYARSDVAAAATPAPIKATRAKRARRKVVRKTTAKHK